jgi:protein tyrosine phosphatase (PTP) superfamily phosphohydrolase (DUF442 family)
MMRSLARRIPARSRLAVVAGFALLIGCFSSGVVFRGVAGDKRVHRIVSGRLLRGAWQSPAALRELIAREQLRTIVTLTAINPDDPKYIAQADVVRRTGVDWVIIPMRGSRATLEQMAQAADLVADPGRQPVFFHCVGGHHRSSLVHAAYLIRHCRYSPERAWQAIAELSWTRPSASADLNDRSLIFQFARSQSALALSAGTVGR